MELADEIPTKGKKRRQTPVKWKRNVLKQAKASGQQRATCTGQEVPPRKQNLLKCRCQCVTKFSSEELNHILRKFNNHPSHAAQNMYLQGCLKINCHNDIRRRPRKEDSKNRSSFSYSITLPSRTVPVCKAALCGLHGIKESRLREKVLKLNTDIRDGRGKHESHPKIDVNVLQMIREQIGKFKTRESHYSRAKNEHRRYLDADLTVAEMYRRFITENPDFKDASYRKYRDIFLYEFNISFGYPRSDICDKCEKMTAEIKSAKASNDSAKLKDLQDLHELHVRNADVFNAQIQEDTEKAKNDGDTAVIAMDYEKNLPLPVTGIGCEFYKRQLWLHNFCIHSVLDEQAHMNVYAEHYAGKGPNEIISCLDHYISQLPKTISKLIIYADNCFSQNKNRYLYAYLLSVVTTRKNHHIKEIEIKYPLPGHSWMPCDRDFGRIEKNRRKKDRVALPSEWVKLIRRTDKLKPFKVYYLEHPLTDNMTVDETPVVTTTDYKSAYENIIKAIQGISEFRGIKFNCNGSVQSQVAMTADCHQPVTILRRGLSLSSLRQAKLSRAYEAGSFIPIKREKFEDVVTLLKHIYLPENVTIYKNLRPRCQSSNDDVKD